MAMKIRHKDVYIYIYIYIYTFFIIKKKKRKENISPCRPTPPPGIGSVPPGF